MNSASIRGNAVLQACSQFLAWHCKCPVIEWYRANRNPIVNYNILPTCTLAMMHYRRLFTRSFLPLNLHILFSDSEIRAWHLPLDFGWALHLPYEYLAYILPIYLNLHALPADQTSNSSISPQNLRNRTRNGPQSYKVFHAVNLHLYTLAYMPLHTAAYLAKYILKTMQLRIWTVKFGNIWLILGRALKTSFLCHVEFFQVIATCVQCVQCVVVPWLKISADCRYGCIDQSGSGLRLHPIHQHI